MKYFTLYRKHIPLVSTQVPYQTQTEYIPQVHRIY